MLWRYWEGVALIEAPLIEAGSEAMEDMERRMSKAVGEVAPVENPNDEQQTAFGALSLKREHLLYKWHTKGGQLASQFHTPPLSPATYGCWTC